MYLFDMDGTLTKEESIPLIASLSDKCKEIESITRFALSGDGDYENNLRRRIDLLKHIPIDKASSIVETIPLRQEIVDFIKCHKESCAIVTSNLDCWVEKLLSTLGCKSFTSKAIVDGNRICSLSYILKKEEIVEQYRRSGKKVVFVGDGKNDLPALLKADISIAFLASAYCDKSLADVCNYTCEDTESLLNTLQTIEQKYKLWPE